MKKFKVHDWVFYEFELHQIQEMDGDKVTKVCNGDFNRYGTDLSNECFHIDMKTKTISDCISYYRDCVSSIQGQSTRDTYRELVEIWVDLCNTEDPDEFEESKWNYLNYLDSFKTKK